MKDILWQELYTAAMVELDRGQLQCRIDAARVAIQNAMPSPSNHSNTGSGEEMQAMRDALQNLQTLQWVELRASMPATRLSQVPMES